MVAFCTGGAGAGGAATVTRALEVADPPGPLAVMVYVVESVGVTLVEPCGATVPTSGATVSCVALVEDQLNVEVSPLLMDVGLACRVTVGCAAGGGAAGGGACATGFLLQPTSRAAATAVKRQTR